MVFSSQIVSIDKRTVKQKRQARSCIHSNYRLDNVDELARTAEQDVAEATLLLQRTLQKSRLPSPGQRNDWPDLLLTGLARNASTEIGAWAEVNGLARETVSRGFVTAYGITPSVLRAELRARTAWLRITRGSDGLCRIAADTGFSDQSHMTRWIHRITGAPPAAWRRSVCGFEPGFKDSSD
jgi:AraC-like DNA-binding protein